MLCYARNPDGRAELRKKEKRAAEELDYRQRRLGYNGSRHGWNLLMVIVFTSTGFM